MIFEFTIFVIGLIGGIAVLVFKHIEIKKQKKVILATITEKTEHHFQSLKDKIVYFIKSINRQNFNVFFINLLHRIFIIWQKFVRTIKNKLLEFDYVKKLVDAVKGKHELNSNREASKFLKDIQVEKKDEM